MTLYGSDLSGIEDLDPFMSVLSGDENEPIALLQSLARRITTQRFALFYDSSYGTDLGSYLSDVEEASVVQGALGIECRKDPRVADAKATITATGLGADVVWTVALEIVPQQGPPFVGTLAISDVSIDVLSIEVE